MSLALSYATWLDLTITQDTPANDLASTKGDALRASYDGVATEQEPRTSPEGREGTARCRRRLHPRFITASSTPLRSASTSASTMQGRKRNGKGSQQQVARPDQREDQATRPRHRSGRNRIVDEGPRTVCGFRIVADIMGVIGVKIAGRGLVLRSEIATRP